MRFLSLVERSPWLVLGLLSVACGNDDGGAPLVLLPERTPPGRSRRGDPVLDTPARGEGLDAGETTSSPSVATGTIFFDSFEGATLDAAWIPVVVHGGVGINTTRAWGGKQSLGVGFGSLPSKGEAKVELRDPAIAAASRVTLRLHVMMPADGYPDRVPLGGLFDTQGDGLGLVVDHTSQLKLEERVGGSVRALATTAFAVDRWTCIALGVDRTSGGVTLAVEDASQAATTSLSSTVDRASMGMTYDGGANPNASVGVYFDDVTIASELVGCP